MVDSDGNLQQVHIEAFSSKSKEDYRDQIEFTWNKMMKVLEMRIPKGLCPRELGGIDAGRVLRSDNGRLLICGHVVI